MDREKILLKSFLKFSLTACFFTASQLCLGDEIVFSEESDRVPDNLVSLRIAFRRTNLNQIIRLSYDPTLQSYLDSHPDVNLLHELLGHRQYYIGWYRDRREKLELNFKKLINPLFFGKFKDANNSLKINQSLSSKDRALDLYKESIYNLRLEAHLNTLIKIAKFLNSRNLLNFEDSVALDREIWLTHLPQIRGSILMSAIQHEDIEMAKFILKRAPHLIYQRDQTGLTVLSYAAAYLPELVPTLRKQGAYYSSEGNIFNWVISGNEEDLKQLEKHLKKYPKDVLLRGENFAPLSLYAANKKVEELLLKYGSPKYEIDPALRQKILKMRNKTQNGSLRNEEISLKMINLPLVGNLKEDRDQCRYQVLSLMRTLTQSEYLPFRSLVEDQLYVQFIKWSSLEHNLLKQIDRYEIAEIIDDLRNISLGLSLPSFEILEKAYLLTSS